MPLAVSEGFIITRFDWKESSLIVRCFTRERGKINIVAKGARRQKSRLGSMLETFSRLKLVLYIKHGSELSTLKEAENLDHYQLIRTELERFAIACFYFEILDTGLAPHEKNSALFALTKTFLESLNNRDWNARSTPPYFLKLVAKLGFAPSLSQCRYCHICSGLKYFDPARGTSVCARCAKKSETLMEISEQLTNKMALVYSGEKKSKELASWQESDMPGFYRFLRRFVEYHFEKGLKSGDFLMQQLSG